MKILQFMKNESDFSKGVISVNVINQRYDDRKLQHLGCILRKLGPTTNDFKIPIIHGAHQRAFSGFLRNTIFGCRDNSEETTTIATHNTKFCAKFLKKLVNAQR